MKVKERKNLIVLAMAVATLMLVGILGNAATAADKFPSRPVQLVVPFGTGGGSDRTMRLFAPYLAKELGVPVNVINIKGGGGWVAWAQMARWDAKKNDHIIGTVNIPHIFAYMDPRVKRKETLDSFGFLAWQSFDPCIWAVREGDERFQTLKEFIAYVKANPNKIVMSTTGVGSDDHMGIAFAEKNIPGFKVKKVYSNNDGKKIAETIGGHTDAVAGNVGYYVSYMLDMKLKPIAVLHQERWHQLPSVPSFVEVTGKKNISFAGRTLVVAKNLPAEKKKIYLDAIKRALNNPEYVMKELKNKNNIRFLTGDDLWKALTDARSMVAEVKFWEMDTK
jgi:tripartite-type tricarboxylate transporter receptor subunit TctC